MKAMKNTTKALFALAFSLMLLAGGFTTVWAQQTEPEPTAQEKDGMAMMKNCPMMKQMMQDSDMMKT